MSEFATLSFILGRTLMFRKRAEKISRTHFLEGVIDSEGNRICAGVGVTYNTLRTALDGLVSKGFIEVHAFVQGRTELIPRVYEVKTDQIIEGKSLAGVQKWIKPEQKVEQKQQFTDHENAENRGSKICYTPYQNLPHLKDILRISNNHKESSIEDYRQPAVPGDKGGEEMHPSANGCTKARQVAEAILSKSKARKAVRASNTSVPARKWNTLTLQALLDAARDRVGPTAPRIVVTAKGAGVLHQRMQAAGVGDVVDCFAWAIANWATISSAQRRSVARSESKRSSEMHKAPNFQDLCYKFPYIHKFYQDRKFTDAQAQAEQTVQAEQVATARQRDAEGRQLRKAAARNADMERERQRNADDQAFQQRRRERYRNPVADDDIPEYQAPVWGGRK